MTKVTNRLYRIMYNTLKLFKELEQDITCILSGYVCSDSAYERFLKI